MTDDVSSIVQPIRYESSLYTLNRLKIASNNNNNNKMKKKIYNAHIVKHKA